MWRGRAAGEEQEFPDFWESCMSPMEGLCQIPGHVVPPPPVTASRKGQRSISTGPCVERGREKSPENALFPNRGISTE